MEPPLFGILMGAKLEQAIFLREADLLYVTGRYREPEGD